MCPDKSGKQPAESPRSSLSRPGTMHDRLEFETCDPICCCEAEPRWQKLAEEQELEKQRDAQQQQGR